MTAHLPQQLAVVAGTGGVIDTSHFWRLLYISTRTLCKFKMLSVISSLPIILFLYS